jgi:hypothetical protein
MLTKCWATATISPKFVRQEDAGSKEKRFLAKPNQLLLAAMRLLATVLIIGGGDVEIERSP